MKFLTYISIVLIFASVNIQADENTFKNHTAGLEVTKPDSWSFLTAQENFDLIKDAEYKDKDFQEMMRKYAAAPLVAMMKYPEPYDDLNPSFKVNIKPFGRNKGADGKQVISMLLPQFKKIFKNFEVIQSPSDVEVSGLKAAYAKVNYTMEIQDGRTFPTTSELWIVPRGDYFFMIGVGSRQNEEESTVEEIKQIINSIKIDVAS